MSGRNSWIGAAFEGRNVHVPMLFSLGAPERREALQYSVIRQPRWQSSLDTDVKVLDRRDQRIS